MAGLTKLDAPSPPSVRIVHMTAAQLGLLAVGDLAGAQRSVGVELSAYLVGAERRAVWQRRVRQVRDTPADLAWVTGLVVDAETNGVVGAAGFHGAPDADGMVEVGYGIAPERRRRGYARAALATMLDRARADPSISVVRATVSPANVASLALVRSLPFEHVGEQWDDEDGLELVYEIPV